IPCASRTISRLVVKVAESRNVLNEVIACSPSASIVCTSGGTGISCCSVQLRMAAVSMVSFQMMLRTARKPPGAGYLSVVQVCDRVVGLGGRELLAVLARELIVDRGRRHRHGLLVVLRLRDGVRVPVRLHGVDGVLRGLRGELLAVLAGELVVYAR